MLYKWRCFRETMDQLSVNFLIRRILSHRGPTLGVNYRLHASPNSLHAEWICYGFQWVFIDFIELPQRLIDTCIGSYFVCLIFANHLSELATGKSAGSSPIKKKFLQSEAEKLEILYAEQTELSLDLYFIK